MAIYPGASVRLIDTKYLPGSPVTADHRVNVHTQAGNGSLFGYYSASGRPSSHFWVPKTGPLPEQYVDTALAAEADLDGNSTTISIEVEGGEEPYTQNQIDLLIPLLSWVLGAHGMSRQVASTSQQNASSHGLSWHRLGIDGNFPALPSIYAGRQQRGGGMLFSSAFGKSCPTNVRIDQLYGIVFPAVLVPTPIPTPEPPQEDDVSYTATGPTGQVWFISGVFKRRITMDGANALANLADPATVPYLQGIDQVTLDTYIDLGGGPGPGATIVLDEG